jgi:hypothetical protein
MRSFGVFILSSPICVLTTTAGRVAGLSGGPDRIGNLTPDPLIVAREVEGDLSLWVVSVLELSKPHPGLVFPLWIKARTLDKYDRVCILLKISAVSEVGHPGALVGAVLTIPVEL